MLLASSPAIIELVVRTPSFTGTKKKLVQVKRFPLLDWRSTKRTASNFVTKPGMPFTIAWNFYDGLSGVARGGCGVNPAPSLKLHAAYS